MEGGINPADQNYYARRQPPPPPPPLPLSSNLHSDRIQHSERSYSPSPHHEAALRSPQLPPKLPFLTTQNLQAATANGFIGAIGSGGGDPDEFYRDYRGVQQSANGYTDVATNNMPSATSESRPGLSSLRSNGNGSTPKHPQISSPHNSPSVAARNHMKTSYRSASSPLDDRMALGTAKSTSALNGYPNSRQQQPSVKDLLKRFDQNNDQPPARKPSPKIPTTNGVGSMRGQTGYQARSSASNPNSRAGSSTRESSAPGRVRSPPTTKTTQRTRFAAEDQHSNNTLSSVARAPRPRQIVSGSNSLASKSLTNLSPTTPNHPPQQPPSNSLFGEVTAAQNAFEIGHGIPRSVGRRTSDSNINPPSWIQERGRLDDDFEAPSPTTAWYRGAATLDDAAKKVIPRSSLGHNRNHSDMPDCKVNTMNGVNPTFSTTVATPISPQASSSRIPVKSNRFSGSSESSSVASTRVNSRAASPSGRGSSLRIHNQEKRPWSPAGRSTTPTNRSKTPTRSRGSRNADLSLNSNASLKAYISAPLPKLSPPLRSSRPRQPVSSASTASSRQKMADRSGSPQQVRTGMKVTRTATVPNPKPKKSPERVIDPGPVDFEAHRAKIKRAYTKSIHETEQAEIRMANMKRLHERQLRNSLAAAEKRSEEKAPELSTTSASSPLPKIVAPPPEPLHIKTSFSPVKPKPIAPIPSQIQDSPTLGDIPGAYVEDDEIPQSAISNATEIENEEQTEAPRLSRMLSSQSIAPIMTSNQMFFSDDQFSPEQAMHGMSHNDDEIQIMLAATPVDLPQPELTPTNAEFSHERGVLPPGAFQEDFSPVKYHEQEFTMEELNANQSDVSPMQQSPVTHMDSEDDPSTPVEFPVHFDMTIIDEAPAVPDILYPDDLISPTNMDRDEGTRFGLQSLRTALAPSVMMDDNGQDNLLTPITDFDYDGSSDGVDGMHGSDDQSQDASRLRELHAPNGNHQSSRLSSWTDYSVSSTDGYSGQDDYIGTGNVSNSPNLDLERKPTPPPKENTLLPSPTVPPKPDGYSPVPSPRFQLSPSNFASPNYGQFSPSSTGNSLGFEERAPSIVSVIPLWHEHDYTPSSAIQQGDISPAPTRTPPPPNFYQKRPASSLYQDSMNDGTRTTSQLTSEDAFSSLAGVSAQGNSTHGSTEVSATTQTVHSNGVLEPQTTPPVELLDPKDAVAETDAAKTIRKNLFKRRMLIKELIDTEGIYLKDMNVVEEIYKGTAEACPKLDANDIKIIFRNTCNIVAFSTKFLEELKSAGGSVYSPRSKGRPGKTWAAATVDGTDDRLSAASTLVEETDEQKDRKTFIGANFGKHLKEMQLIYTDYLKTSEVASSRLHALQTDSAVKVWLGECNLVAKDLTQAWDIDALLVKPVQRITRYQLFLKELSHVTSDDHPDYQALQLACLELASLLKHIDDLKRRIDVVGKIVTRKRKESDVRTGIAKAFGRRTEKLQATNSNRPPEDEDYIKLRDKFGDDYLRLQVVMRDVEFYTRQCTTYVNDFLRYLSSMELIMRMSASPYPELESKWARFNMSMRDMGTIALEDHITSVRQKVIEPFEQVIKAYGPPGLAMKKRSKRRLDYEKSLGVKVKDSKLIELVDQYEALNVTLKLELPRLSVLTETIGNIALIQFVNIQVQWYLIWQEKVKIVLEESQIPKDIEGIVDMFSRDYKYVEARAQELGIVNGNFDGLVRPRASQSTQDDESLRAKHRPSNLLTRPRGQSITSDKSPSLPTPDFLKSEGQFTFSPMVATAPGLPSMASYAGPAYTQAHTRVGSGSPATPDPAYASRYSTSARPGTSLSHSSDAIGPRPSMDYPPVSRRESSYSASRHVDGPPSSTRPYSGLFTSALPDGPESRRSSRGSSRDHGSGEMRPNVLYLAASLFEFNISATKSEAGYPYLTYQAGEIFDVIGEKGELWLAKNQDDPSNMVGWIWSKHFARLATD